MDADMPSSSGAEVARKCQHFIARKRRNCKFDVVPGQDYCGNHLPAAAGEPAAPIMPRTSADAACTGAVAEAGRAGRKPKSKERIPCPADPKHTVAVSQLAAHLKKCPAAQQAAARQALPYFALDLNAGMDDAESQGLDGSINSNPFAPGRAAERAAAAKAMGKDGFLALLDRLKDAYEQECCSPPSLAELRPSGLEALVDLQQQQDASQAAAATKHARQAASILGHLLELGILPLQPSTTCTATAQGRAQQHKDNPANITASSAAEQNGACTAQQDPRTDETGPIGTSNGLEGHPRQLLSGGKIIGGGSGGGVVVELGAGKGVLAGMLAAAPQQLTGVAGLVLIDYRAALKHKADRNMRHVTLQRITMDLKDLDIHRLPMLHTPCVRVLDTETQGVQPQQGGGNAAGPVGCLPGSSSDSSSAMAQAATLSAADSLPGWAVLAKHLCGAATDYALRAAMRYTHHPHSGAAAAAAAGPAAAACGTESGAVMARGNATTATTTSAAPATDVTDVAKRLKGIAIATCCHHRCAWVSYVGKEYFKQLGFSPLEFEIISWMTGWALCGHDCAPGTAPGTECDREEDMAAAKQDQEAGDGSDTGCDSTCMNQSHKRSRSDSAQAEEVIQGKRSGIQFKDMGNLQQLACDRPAGTLFAAAGGCISKPWVEEMGTVWDPAKGLERPYKMLLGAMAKMLIDRGRLIWLCGQLGVPAPMPGSWGDGAADKQVRHAQLVRYVSECVSGENKLLLARI